MAAYDKLIAIEIDSNRIRQLQLMQNYAAEDFK